MYYCTMKNPIESLKHFVSQAGGLRKAGEALGYSHETIRNVIKGTADIPLPMADKLGWVKKERWVRRD